MEKNITLEYNGYILKVQIREEGSFVMNFATENPRVYAKLLDKNSGDKFDEYNDMEDVKARLTLYKSYFTESVDEYEDEKAQLLALN